MERVENWPEGRGVLYLRHQEYASAPGWGGSRVNRTLLPELCLPEFCLQVEVLGTPWVLFPKILPSLFFREIIDSGKFVYDELSKTN
jgi:hypothetical protein